MSTEDQYVILNPYSKLSPQEKSAVHVNEAARLYMNKHGVPDVSLTKEQEQNLAGLNEYANAEPQYRKATMLARILSGDPSAGIPTMEQSEAIKPMLFLRGLKAKGGLVTDTDVHQGGLKASNYPNPYGLRSWQDEQGNYRGQMMPKTSGWQGEIPTLTGDVMTEQSLGDNTSDEPFFPMISQNMTPRMIKTVQEFEAGILDPNHPDVQALMKHAREQAQRLMRQGKSPFKDYN